MVNLVAWYLLALAVSVALVPACRWIAIRLGYVATPKADRWHQKQTALLGGVAIAGTALGLGVALHPAAGLALLMVLGALVALVGLVDDLLSLKPYSKLVAQIGLASAFLWFDFRLGWVDSQTLDTMLTLIWLVGITNAFNLLDNMDGLCAGVGLIVAATLMLGFATSGDMAHAAYLAILAGALSGFLVYNFNPASIFMGDSGSLFIGFTLAAIALEPGTGPRVGSSVLAIVGAPLLVLLIPIFDTTFVTISRLLSGRSPAQGGRDHSSHRLVAMGLSERAAVRVLWTLAAFGGVIGIALRDVAPDLALPLAAAFVLALVIFAVYLARVRVYESTDASLLRTGKVTPVVVDFMYKRRVAEVLLDLCLVPLCYYAAYRLRFEGPEYQLFFPSFMESLPLVVGLQITALFAVGGYRGVWRHFGLMDGVVFAKGVAAGTTAIVIAVLYLYRFEQYSRGVFVIYAALLMLALAGSRASFRLMGEFIRRRSGGRRLVIYGAGDGGSLVLRELLTDRGEQYRMLGYIDDDGAKHKTRLQGYPVLGDLATLRQLVAGDGVDLIVVSAREMDPARLKQLAAICSDHGVALSRLHFQLEPLVGS
jgi:UDP-GlcNAc:undecaprenyl-phosphate/decaprenyl-phosphate GlcNAc-1-phosphate transferase